MTNDLLDALIFWTMIVPAGFVMCVVFALFVAASLPVLVPAYIAYRLYQRKRGT